MDIGLQTPDLSGPRLRMRPFADRHLTARYVAWLNDPETTRFSEQRHRRHSLAECAAYAKAVRADGHFFWAVEEIAAGRHIGNITATIDRPNRVADVALLIGEKEYWNKGYGSEAFGTVCRYFLDSGGIRKVTAGTMAENTGMLAVMRKAGMVEDGRRSKHFLLEGRPVDLVYGALFVATDGK